MTTMSCYIATSGIDESTGPVTFLARDQMWLVQTFWNIWPIICVFAISDINEYHGSPAPCPGSNVACHNVPAGKYSCICDSGYKFSSTTGECVGKILFVSLFFFLFLKKSIEKEWIINKTWKVNVSFC